MIVLCVAQVSRAQIKVTSNGNIGLKTTNPSYPIEMLGQTKIRPNSASSWGLLFDNSGPSGIATLRPSNSAWHGSLGTSTYFWGYSYIESMESAVCKTEALRSNTHINNYNFVFSDVKIKSNIKSIENPLNILLQLNGKKYDMLPDNQGLHKEKEKKEKKDEYGFIAQEFMEVLPELTILDTLTNLYAINYTGLIPILVEALKYQQVEIDELRDALEESTAKEKSATIETSVNENVINAAFLAQNIPNPFSESTVINLQLPASVAKANLFLYNMQGTQIMKFEIIERGQTAVTIEGYALNAGMLCHYLKFCNDGLSQMA